MIIIIIKVMMSFGSSSLSLDYRGLVWRRCRRRHHRPQARLFVSPPLWPPPVPPFTVRLRNFVPKLHLIC